jgi:hypothetical protein
LLPQLLVKGGKLLAHCAQLRIHLLMATASRPAHVLLYPCSQVRG